ncbi:hypothetical protein FB567DRAFT_596561 [Paraphoma chrysanthemicola]|uniref:Uncharacterized protein n=1 Tax=Paraphoma chrysanthemicola TaxID=798071 RepID=A0A8K0VU89_9PLEO|nr:hypothetical protein FB567DRAFT_596561 [Paraphoma chrysanthemicola]
MANPPSKKTAGEFKAMPAKEQWDINADPDRKDPYDNGHLPLKTTLKTSATASIDDIIGSTDHDFAIRRQPVPNKLLDVFLHAKYLDKLGRFHKVSTIIPWVYKPIDLRHYQDTARAMVASGKETARSVREKITAWDKTMDDIMEDSARYIAAEEELPPSSARTSPASTMTGCDVENEDEESVEMVKAQWMEHAANEMAGQGVGDTGATEEDDNEIFEGGACNIANKGGDSSNLAASEDQIRI